MPTIPNPQEIPRSTSGVPAFPKEWREVGRANTLAANPTTILFQYDEGHVKIRWNSRAQRKGRYVEIQPLDDSVEVAVKPPFRWFGWEWGNLSWWVAWLFFWGSVLWTINGAFKLWPAATEVITQNVRGYTALFGGIAYIVGCYFMVLESLNVGAEALFGYTMQQGMQQITG